MNSTIPADLLDLKDRFETWRTTRKYLREPIPDELRQAATEMSQRYSPALVGRVLKLDSSRLKKLGAKPARRKAPLKKPQGAFFKLPTEVILPESNASVSQTTTCCRLFFERPDGARLWLVTRRFSQGKLRWWPTDSDAPLHALEAHQLSVLLYNGLPDQAHFAPVWRPLTPATDQAASSSSARR